MRYNRPLRTPMKTLLRLLSISAAGLPLLQAADRGVTAKMAYESAYVSYGVRYAKSTFVPMIDAFAGDYYAGIWGFLPPDSYEGFKGEWDIFGGRTIKMNDLVSIDVGGTLYHYPESPYWANTFEGFFWLNFALPLKPKLKLYYDFTISNWIGEAMVSHSLPLSKKTSFSLSGHFGFRQPNNFQKVYYATAKADLVYSLSEKAQLSIGIRGTDNSKHWAVGHGLIGWFGTSLGYTW